MTVLKHRCHPVLFLVGLALATPSMMLAQAGRGELTGEVRDASGGVIVGARVVATQSGTNQEALTSTTTSGAFTLTGLRPGRYAVSAEAPGFRKVIQEGIDLFTGVRTRADFNLPVGAHTDAVKIQAAAPLLRTESGSLGQVVENRSVQDLPLKDRNFIQLVALSTGVALPPGSAFPRINGGRPRVNEYLYDGISVLQPEPGQPAFFPIVDAIEEFKVETNSPPAEFGRFSGGVINLSTRSGTNTLHGSLFEYFRHEDLNARNLFALPTDPKPHFRKNQYGFTLGGPIQRDRTFFFADYQGTRQRIGRIRISTVPTLLQRQGIFTEAVAGKVPKIYDPATTVALPGGKFSRTQFTGNSIPAARFDPAAAELLNRYPIPTSVGTANNYRRVGTEVQNQEQFDVRIDHRFSDRDQAFGRYSLADDDSLPVAPFPDGSGNLASGVIGPSRTRGQSVVYGQQHAFSPHVIGEFRFGYTRRALERQALLLDAPPSQSLGIPGIPEDGVFETELPTFLVSGYQQLGPPSNTDSEFRTDVTQFVGMATIQSGKHVVKTGADLRWSRMDIVQPPSPAGQFRFTNLFTDLPGTSGTGFSMASFLLGQVQDFSIDMQQQPLRPRAHTAELFVSDDWKATSKLTFNAGLRYTLNFPSTEVDNQGAVFNLASEQLDYLGRGGFPRSARDLHKGNFGPRVGFAWQVTPKTVVHSAYGIIWIDLAGITTPFINPQFPFLQTITQRSLDNINPALVLSNGPNVTPVAATPDAGLGQGVFTADRNLGSGYAQHWSFSIQRELSRNSALEIGYTGSKGTDIGIPDTNINQLTVDQLSVGNPLLQRVANPYFGEIPLESSIGGSTVPLAQLMRPYPRFTTVAFYRNNVGNTIYHGLQVKFERRFTRHFSALVSYTWSKLIDEASSVFDASILTGPVANFPVADSFNRHLERDLSTGDIPHSLVASWVYDLPLGEHSNGIKRVLLGGWQASGILTLQSGLPLAVTQSTNFNSFAGFGTQRPNCTDVTALPGSERNADAFFNVDAFAIAPQFTLGGCSRNPVRGPGFAGLDVALVKRTPLGERVSLDFRTEIFNLTNTPPLGAPNAVLGTAGFGSITSAGDPRVIQFALKLQF